MKNASRPRKRKPRERATNFAFRWRLRFNVRQATVKPPSVAVQKHTALR